MESGSEVFLIDTLLLELPVPPVYIRIVQSGGTQAVVREIIDGQQRLSAILDYIDDKYTLAKNIESPFYGKRFSQLEQEQKNTIAHYPFICEVFYGVADREVLRIFSRMNTNSVKLNDQELRNGQYFGEFKRSCYDLAFEHLEFWRQNQIFTEQNIARMQEVELTSELIILSIDGLQDKNKSINGFYDKFDEHFESRSKYEANFRHTIDVITNSSSETLANTEFRRVPLFYSLFAAVYHRLFGVRNIELPTPAKGRFNKEEYEGLQNSIATLSQALEGAKEGYPVPVSESAFVAACLSQTDNVRPRQIRMESIYKSAFV